MVSTSRRLGPTRKLERLKEERSKKGLTEEEGLKELACNQPGLAYGLGSDSLIVGRSVLGEIFSLAVPCA
jgi:hypothetical protein